MSIIHAHDHVKRKDDIEGSHFSGTLMGKAAPAQDRELLLRIAKQDPALLVGLRLSGMLGSIRAQFFVCGIENNQIYYDMTTGDNPPEKVEHAIESLKYKSIDVSYQRECLRLFAEGSEKAA